MLGPIAIALAIYLAWSIGGNDVANSMGTVYGTRALSLKKALILAAGLEFLGAVFLSGPVTETIGKGIVPSLDIVAILCIMAVSALWLTIASFKRMPISCTQAVIGALIGYGLVSAVGMNFAPLGVMGLSWLITPFVALGLAGGLYYFLSRFLTKTIKTIKDKERIHKFYVYVQIVSAGLLCLAHGANDGGLAIGIMYNAFPNLIVLGAISGGAMALGILTIGKRVVKMIGRGITFLTPLSGCIAQATAGTLILALSIAGIPVSTTHIVLGALVGVGLKRIKWANLRKVMLFSFATIPVTAALMILLKTVI